MAAEISLFSAHPVNPNKCKAHGHEYETQCCETCSLKTKRNTVHQYRITRLMVLLAITLIITLRWFCECLLSQSGRDISLPGSLVWRSWAPGWWV